MTVKKWMIWLIVILLAITLYCLVFFLPLSYPYFFPSEEIELHFIDKTTLHVPEGETVERYEAVEFSREEIIENIDVDALIAELPNMRVTVYSDYLTSRWVGDVTYEISGIIKSGLRKHTSFHIDLGIPEESHLRIGARNWGRRVVDPQQWIDFIAGLEQ